jgi:putative copper resistance protein D
MDLGAKDVHNSLIVVRAVHFAATTILAGSLIFWTVVAQPILRSSEAATIVRLQTLRIAWITLAIAVVSGVIWVLLQAASMSGLPLADAMTADVMSAAVIETQFGFVLEIRFVLAIILAACLAYDRLPWVRWLALASALGLIAAIAWTGHAGSTAGEVGLFHLTADVLHLVFAATWIGGLVSLVFLLAVARRYDSWAHVALRTTQRFSTLALISVGSIVATGIVNAWILVGSLHALIVTEYGRLLMLKLTLFAAMLMMAAANRFWLTPRLALHRDAGRSSTPCVSLRATALSKSY